MFYRNAKAKFRSSDKDKNYFNIIAAEYIRYISSIFVYNLPRQRTPNDDRSDKRKWLYTKIKRQDIEDIPQTL